MHKDAMDCFIELFKIQYEDSKRIKGRASWFNLGFTGNPWVIRLNDPIEIRQEHAEHWIPINPLKHRIIKSSQI